MNITIRISWAVFCLVLLTLATPVQAVVILDFEDFTTTNADISASYGSNLPGAPNVALNWATGATSGHWDEYTDWGPGRTRKVQLDFADPGDINTIDLLFTPQAGFSIYVTGFDLDSWGSAAVNWSLLDGASTLFSGSWTPASDGTTPIVTGMTSANALAGPLTARFNLNEGGGRGNAAMDNLQFGQINTVPEPSVNLMLLSASLWMLVSRRRRRTSKLLSPLSDLLNDALKDATSKANS